MTVHSILVIMEQGASVVRIRIDSWQCTFSLTWIIKKLTSECVVLELVLVAAA